MNKLLICVLAAVIPAWASAQAAEQAPRAELAGCCESGCADLVGYYTKVSSALAKDDLKAAQDGAAELTCWASCSGTEALAAQMDKFQAAKTLEAARAAFKTISTTVILLAAEAGPHYVMTCPMAGADWIQTEAPIANPYFGASMLTCGSVKQTVGVSR